MWIYIFIYPNKDYVADIFSATGKYFSKKILETKLILTLTKKNVLFDTMPQKKYCLIELLFA